MRPIIWLFLLLASGLANAERWELTASYSLPSGEVGNTYIDFDSIRSDGDIATFWEWLRSPSLDRLSVGSNIGYMQNQKRLDCRSMYEMEINSRFIDPKDGQVMRLVPRDSAYSEKTKKYHNPDTIGFNVAKEVCEVANSLRLDAERQRAWLAKGVSEKNAQAIQALLMKKSASLGKSFGNYRFYGVVVASPIGNPYLTVLRYVREAESSTVFGSSKDSVLVCRFRVGGVEVLYGEGSRLDVATVFNGANMVEPPKIQIFDGNFSRSMEVELEMPSLLVDASNVSGSRAKKVVEYFLKNHSAGRVAVVPRQPLDVDFLTEDDVSLRVPLDMVPLSGFDLLWNWSRENCGVGVRSSFSGK